MVGTVWEDMIRHDTIASSLPFIRTERTAHVGMNIAKQVQTVQIRMVCLQDPLIDLGPPLDVPDGVIATAILFDVTFPGGFLLT